ncbi:MAG: hypothetical protein K2Q25_10195 [Mycobacteriaceae bacterium]|nr:hypothetical protein [Mycobacteriaceae bacterium]
MTNIFNIFTNPGARVHIYEPGIYVDAYAVGGEIELPAIVTDARIATLHDEMDSIHVNAIPSRLSVVISALEQVIQVVGAVATVALVGSSLATPALQGCLGETGVSLFLQVIATAVQVIWMIMLAITNFRYGQAGYVDRNFDPLRQALADTQKLLYPMIAIFEGLELLSGFGAPDTGDKFKDGYINFSGEIFDILYNASPTPSEWSGDAATYYADKNQQQQTQVQEFADADHQIASILTKQAAQIDQTRQGMAGAKLGFLGAMTVLEPLLEQAATACDAASAWRMGDLGTAEIQHQIAVSKTKLYMDLVGVAAFSAIITFLGLIITSVAKADENRKNAKRVTSTYKSVIHETQSIVLSTLAPAEAPTMVTTTVTETGARIRSVAAANTTARLLVKPQDKPTLPSDDHALESQVSADSNPLSTCC